MAPAAATKTRFRNPELKNTGIRTFGRSQAFSKSGHWRFVKKGAAGKKLVAAAKPTSVVRRLPKTNPNASKKIAKLRSGLVPGSVLIILAGRFQGKRVVFLKQLPTSGLLLVSGPFEVNGVPLRRVNQSYCIVTSQKVDVAGVDVSSVEDVYFKRISNDTTTNQPKPEKHAEWLKARKETQKKVDAALIKSIAAVPLLKEYLGARFSLQNGQAPHLMKF